MKEHIKELRKFFGLTQSEFGESIGVSRDVVGNLELGRVEPSELIIKMICKTYHVNQEWLETGQGEMLVEQTRDERIAAFVGQALSDEGDEFKRDLIGLLAALDEDGWQKLKEAAEALKKAADNPE